MAGTHTKGTGKGIATLKSKLKYNKHYSAEATSSGRYDDLVDGQCPDVTLVTCSDSRVWERSLDDQIGKIFSIKNIGNRVEPNMGSIQYGVGYLHTPILMIMGHTGCGAIHASTLELDARHMHILQSLDSIKPTLAEVQKLIIRKGGAASYIEAAHVKPASKIGEDVFLETLVTEANVDKQIENLLNDTSIRKLVYSDRLMIVGTIYDFKDIYSREKGAIFVINVNGETDVERLKKLAMAVGDDRIDPGHIKRLLVY